MVKRDDFFKRNKWRLIVLVIVIVVVTAWYLFKMGGYVEMVYSIALTDDIEQAVDNTTAEFYRYGVDQDSFIIVANKIHGAYRQGDTIKVFVITYSANYSVTDSNTSVTESTKAKDDAGIIPAAITYMITSEVNTNDDIAGTQTMQGETWQVKDFTVAEDGSSWKSSIEKFCTLPSGATIPGLANRMIAHYSHYSDLIRLHKNKLQDYLSANRLTDSEFD